MPALPKRFYIITGKGGVGKTTIALAFTQWLRSQNHNAVYFTLSQQALSDEKSAPDEAVVGWPEVPHVHLDLEECAEGYIQKKLGSTMIAKLIVRTAFFRALVNMLPGFGYVISMGRMLEELKLDSSKIIVLDAPASGHALTMMEATGNFREIFQAGMVFEDTEKMLKYLYDPAHTGVRIITLPTTLALQEAIELREAVHKLAPLDAKIYLNHSLSRWELVNVPSVLGEKLKLEEEVLRDHAHDIGGTFPYSAASSTQELYQDVSQNLETLL